jgi:murein L,D-transpeptidase YafK
MQVALGRDAEGHKRRAGDHRTPEGDYQVVGSARPGRYHLFLPIDYPSPSDTEAAFVEGRLSKADYDRIREAHAAGALPPDDTAIGGNLGFHGEGDRWRGESRHLDWTYGCIALTDDEIELLAARVGPGVPVRIHP